MKPWEKYQNTEVPSSEGPWSKYGNSNVSNVESLARGTAQGVTMNLADEATGGIETIYNTLFGNEKFNDFVDNYQKHRDESRKKYKEAEEANPNSYLAGQVAGGIGSALVMPTSAPTLVGRAAQAAGMGAVMGYGANENRDELLKDMALNASIGAVSVPVVEGASALAKKGLQKAGQFVDETLTPKVGKALFGVDERATQNYLKNPDAVNKAPELGELADMVLSQADDGSVINQMKKKVSGLSSEGWDELSKSTNINKHDLLALGDDFAQGVLKGKDGTFTRTSATGADKKALEAIYKELDNIQVAYGDNLSEEDLKSIIQSLQNMSYGSDTFTADKLKQLSGVFNESLKSGNNQYANVMAKTQDATKALDQVKSIFQNRQTPENYDKFTKAVKNLVNKDELSAANQAVEKIKKHTGYDLGEDITNAWSKSQFEKGDINGSRNTLFGTVLGGSAGSLLGPAGGVIGGAIGSAVGRGVDKYAGPIFKKMLDGRISAGEFSESLAPILGKFSQPLMSAIERGPAAISSTHFLLMSNNPEYRQMIKKMDEEDQ